MMTTKRFSDLFDVIDDETDVLEYAQSELDAYFQTGLLDGWMLDRYDDGDEDGLGQVSAHYLMLVVVVVRRLSF